MSQTPCAKGALIGTLGIKVFCELCELKHGRKPNDFSLSVVKARKM